MVYFDETAVYFRKINGSKSQYEVPFHISNTDIIRSETSDIYKCLE